MQQRTINEDIYKELMADNIRDNKRVGLKDNDAIRTPLNKIPTIPKKVEKKKSKIKEEFLIDNTSESKSMFGNIVNLTSPIFDALIGAVLLFLVTSSPVNTVLSKFVNDFYQVSQSPVYNDSNQNQALFFTTPIERQISLKGRLMQMILFIILYIVIKNWVLVE